MEPKKLVLDVETRWNSTCDMLSTAQEMSKPLDRYVGASHGLTPIGEDGWKTVKMVLSLLAPFKVATELISGSNYPSICLSRSALCVLLDELYQLLMKFTCIRKLPGGRQSTIVSRN
jgi:hypothetical protein